LAFSSSVTCAGLALPPLAFMAWPTRRVEALALPARYFLDVLRVLGDDLVEDRVERAGVAHLLQALGFDDRVDVAAFAGPQASNTWRAALLEIVPSAMRLISCRQLRALTARPRCRSRRVQAARHLAHDPVAGQLGLAPALHRFVEVAASALLCVSCAGVVFRQAVVA
jgi:hypothetical protein